MSANLWDDYGISDPTLLCTAKVRQGLSMAVWERCNVRYTEEAWTEALSYYDPTMTEYARNWLAQIDTNLWGAVSTGKWVDDNGDTIDWDKLIRISLNDGEQFLSFNNDSMLMLPEYYRNVVSQRMRMIKNLNHICYDEPLGENPSFKLKIGVRMFNTSAYIRIEGDFESKVALVVHKMNSAEPEYPSPNYAHLTMAETLSTGSGDYVDIEGNNMVGPIWAVFNGIHPKSSQKIRFRVDGVGEFDDFGTGLQESQIYNMTADDDGKVMELHPRAFTSDDFPLSLYGSEHKRGFRIFLERATIDYRPTFKFQ